MFLKRPPDQRRTWRISWQQDFHIIHYPDSNVGWANVGPTSGRQYRRWVNVGPTYIAVWVPRYTLCLISFCTLWYCHHSSIFFLGHIKPQIAYIFRKVKFYNVHRWMRLYHYFLMLKKTCGDFFYECKICSAFLAPIFFHIFQNYCTGTAPLASTVK